jgi:hypothetical protein
MKKNENLLKNVLLKKNAVIVSFYLVKYYGGSYEDSFQSFVFVTNKKSTATKYCTKFNKILKKWQDYYKQFETKKYGTITWIADEHIEKKFSRWNQLNAISRCCYVEVAVR